MLGSQVVSGQDTAGLWSRPIKAGVVLPDRSLIVSKVATATPQNRIEPRSPPLRDVDKENSRPYRRTVYDFEKWATHRSTQRYGRNLTSMLSSRIISSLSVPIAGTCGMAALAATYETLVNQGALGGTLPHIMLPQAPITVTSFALSLLLVFRTNTSYFRWNEARTIWGGVLNRSRDIVRMGVTAMEPEDVVTKQLLTRWTIAFSKSLMAHLREDGDLDKLLGDILPPEELAKLKASPHRPVYVLHMLTEIVARAKLNPNIEVMINTNLTYFHDALGGCERLLRTPIPLSYTRHTCRFLLLWLFILPFTLVGQLGWGVVPATGLISMLLLGIEEIGVQIEEPFGILSLESISGRAELDAKEQLRVHFDTRQFLDMVAEREEAWSSFDWVKAK